MARVHLFADEAGNFDFSSKSGASRYFILTTVTVSDFRVGDALLGLRRQLAWEGQTQASNDFHATEELQAVRDRVFAELVKWDFRLDCTILDKRKAHPQLAADDVRFYRRAWFLHLKYLTPLVTESGDELLVVGSSLGTKKKRQSFESALREVVKQTSHNVDFRTVSWACSSDPCLWVADYCCWALQRKWERSDVRSYALIEAKISSEFDAFRHQSRLYYE